MARLISEVRVIGLGKVGELVATLLADAGFTVTAYDARQRSGLPFQTATARRPRRRRPARRAARALTRWSRACRFT